MALVLASTNSSQVAPRLKIIHLHPGKSIIEWEALDPLDIIHFTVTQTSPDIMLFNKNIPPELKRVVDIMLAKNKKDRVQVRKENWQHTIHNNSSSNHRHQLVTFAN